ncbi:hypothetical protein JCM11491_000430 [Sporobolomyces phaffii]
MSRVIAAAEHLARSHHAQYDPSHDFHHVSRVTRLALVVAASLSPPVDQLVVHLAALFHDLLDRKYLPRDEPAPTPPERLAPFWSAFSPADVSPEQRALVEQIIDNVSYSKEVKRLDGELGGITPWHAECRELHCVQDADKLDAIGAFGILRCAAYSAVANRPLYDPADPAQGDAIAHFGDKLVHLAAMLKTDKARQLAQRRSERLTQFVQWTRDEYDDLDDLASPPPAPSTSSTVAVE